MELNEDNLAPAFYVVKQGCNDTETANLLHAMKITPILAVIIVDPADADFALMVSDEVMRTTSVQHSHSLAREIHAETGRPVLVVGEAQFLDAYYSDGRVEPVIPNA